MNPFPTRRKILTVPGCDSFRIVLHQDLDGDVDITAQVKRNEGGWKDSTFIWLGEEDHILARLGFPTEPPTSEETVEGVLNDDQEVKP